jgi:hypothetical protein
VIQPPEREHDPEKQPHGQQDRELLQRRQADQRKHDPPRHLGLRRLPEDPCELIRQQDREQHAGHRGKGHGGLAQQVAIKPCQHESRLRMGNGRLRRLHAAGRMVSARRAAQV